MKKIKRPSKYELGIHTEAQLEDRIREDLAMYFDVVEGQKVGKHRSTGRRIRPDIICVPGMAAKQWGFTQPFTIECKLLPEYHWRSKLSQAYHQAREQVNEAIYKDFGMIQFGMVATLESYTGFTDRRMFTFNEGMIKHGSQINVGFLTFPQVTIPNFLMSHIGGDGPNGIKYKIKPLWQPYDQLDTNQLVIKTGSTNSREKIT